MYCSCMPYSLHACVSVLVHGCTCKGQGVSVREQYFCACTGLLRRKLSYVHVHCGTGTSGRCHMHVIAMCIIIYV